MTYEQVIQAIEKIKKGAFYKMTYATKKTPLAKHKGDLIEKHSSGVYRFGIGYYNMEKNKEKEIRPSTKGDFQEGYKNLIIERIDKNGNKVYYLRVYTTNHKTTSQWTLNKEKVTKEYLIENGYLSNRPSQPIDCFDVNIENIIEIGVFSPLGIN